MNKRKKEPKKNDIIPQGLLNLEYQENESFLGHTFMHIKDGVYKPDSLFQITKSEFEQMAEVYDSSACIFVTGNMLEHEKLPVLYALNTKWCRVPVCDGAISSFLYWMLENGETEDVSSIMDLIRSGARFICKEHPYEDYPDYFKSDGKVLFEPTNLKQGKLGERPLISLNGYWGVLVEPGIYFFPQEGIRYQPENRRAYVPQLNLNAVFDEKCAMIALQTIHFSLSPLCRVAYFAAGEEACVRLKELEKTKEGFYHEFRTKVSSSNVKKYFQINGLEKNGGRKDVRLVPPVEE